MGAKIGTGDVSFRLGSATPAAVSLGSEQVWTAVSVPGAPTITGASYGEEGEESVPVVYVTFANPESDGGSPITGYVFYYKGDSAAATFISEAFGWRIEPGEFAIGQEVQVAAVNAVGEGPKSDPVTVT